MSDMPKQIVDVAAVSVTVTTVIELLPAWAALFTIVWTSMRIYEWFEKRWGKKKDVEIQQDESE